jgi:Ca2+:H+ antiporter
MLAPAVIATSTSAPEPTRSEPTLGASLKAIATSSWLNILIVFVPVSWALHYAKPDEDIIIFICAHVLSIFARALS